MSRILDADDRALLVRYLRRGAAVHEARSTNLVIDGTTAAAIAATLDIPGVDSRCAHALTPRQARTTADQLEAVGREVAA